MELMNTSQIPEEAVVAAAKVLYADKISNHAGDNAAEIIDACEKIASKALEAAAPHMQPTISTVEELAALPIGSVLIDGHGDLYRRVGDDFAPWDDCEGGQYGTVDLPARLIRIPNPYGTSRG